jgi:steroid delta-isomerase-like uncharacterized protein
MTPDLATYAEAINEAWNSHDIEKVIGFYSPEYVGDDVGLASPVRGRDGMRTMLESYWRAFPDLRFKVIGTVVEGIRLAILWIGEGTHHGTIMNIPPTGHKVEVRGVSVIDVEDGLVVRGQYVWDLAGMLRHMGLLPELQTRKESR